MLDAAGVGVGTLIIVHNPLADLTGQNIKFSGHCLGKQCIRHGHVDAKGPCIERLPAQAHDGFDICFGAFAPTGYEADFKFL